MCARIVLTALVVLPLVAAGANAQSYELKIKRHADAGKSVTVDETAKVKIAFSVALGGNVLKEEKKVADEVKQYTEKVLETDQKGRQKFTRTYSKAAKGDDGELTDLSYAGKTIVFERQDGQYTATGEGVDEKDLKELSKSVNNSTEEQQLVPKKSVQVGDTWTIPKDALSSMLGQMKGGADFDKLKAQGKLVKAYKKAGQQWGTLEISVAVPIKQFGPLALEKAIPFTLKLTLDTPIDGSSTANQSKGLLTVKGASEFEQNGQTITLDVSIEGDLRHEQGAEK